jgi:aflatoxin B1 aldehyde reductase
MTPKHDQENPIIALGTMTFGAQTSAADADRMLRMFLGEGYSWVDTAFMYTEGRSERILGRLLKGRTREKVFLATKAYPDKLGKGKPRGLTPGSVRGQLETSLRRLRMDHVDLFYLHAPDNRTPLEVTLAACRDLVSEGKARAIGLSNYASWQVAEAALLCARNDWPAPAIYQGMYDAATRDVERECIPSCRHFGLRFIAYNPLAGGLLTGKHTDLRAIPSTGRFSGEYYRGRYWKEEYFAAVRELQEAARRSRISPAAASLRWLLHHSKSDGLLLGASKVEHLRENLAACRRGPLSPAFVRAFDKVWERTMPVCQKYSRD